MSDHDDKEAKAQKSRADRWDYQERVRGDGALREILSTPFGRQTLWWILRIGAVGMQPFHLDPYKTAFACGELNVGQQVLARIIEVDPASYLLMQKENQDNATRRSVFIDGTSDSGHAPGDTVVLSDD